MTALKATFAMPNFGVANVNAVFVGVRENYATTFMVEATKKKKKPS